MSYRAWKPQSAAKIGGCLGFTQACRMAPDFNPRQGIAHWYGEGNRSRQQHTGKAKILEQKPAAVTLSRIGTAVAR